MSSMRHCFACGIALDGVYSDINWRGNIKGLESLTTSHTISGGIAGGTYCDGGLSLCAAHTLACLEPMLALHQTLPLSWEAPRIYLQQADDGVLGFVQEEAPGVWAMNYYPVRFSGPAIMQPHLCHGTAATLEEARTELQRFIEQDRAS